MIYGICSIYRIYKSKSGNKKFPIFSPSFPADTYLLKSLDTFDFDGLNGKERLAIIPCGGNRGIVRTDAVGG